MPLLSFVWLRGRCRSCGAAIPADHVGIEAVALGIAAIAVLGEAPDRLIVTCLFGWWLLLLAAIDRRRGILPDVLTLPLIVLGFAETAMSAPADALAGVLRDRAIGAALGYLVFAGLAFLYRRLRRRDGLGLGDAKLLAAGGAWLGWAALPHVVLAAALGALIAALSRARGRASAQTVIIFGPWLAAAIWLARLVQDRI